MNKKHFNLLMILLLVAGNVVLLYFLMQKPKSHFHPDQPKNTIIERLHLDKNQITAYEKLIDQHRKDIRENDAKIIDLKNQLYLLLNEKNEPASVDSLTSEIANIQKNIETIHFNHFQDIKSICKAEQMPEFKALSKDLAGIFNHKKHPKNRPE